MSNYNEFHPDGATLFRFNVTNYNIANWKTATSGDANSITTDPAFVNAGGSYNLDTDFKIPTGSPAKDAGVDVGLTVDYFGNAVPYNSLYDIGAHEYTEGANPPILFKLMPGTIFRGKPGTTIKIH